MDISGQVAVVTGGASGLGLATAQALAAKGAKIVVLDRNAEAADRAAGLLGGFGVACDVSSAADVENAFATVERVTGPARVLVNCAGIATGGRVVGRDGPLALDEFAKIINVNLIGTFNATRVAAHRMSTLEPLAEGERGVIISTASVAAFDGQIGQAAYSASKGGVAAMTLPIARELARFGIRVVTIAPGLFETPLLGTLPPEIQVSLGAAIPFPARLGKASEFADLAAHIVANTYLNGETIRLDGALRMAPK